MDNFNHAFDKICDQLKSGYFESYSLYFSLKTDYERFKFCFTLLEEAKLFPLLSSTKIKNGRESEKFRNEGNSAYFKRDDIKALEYYTMSVALAPPESQEIALAFANRSAVSFSLKNFKDCITDIDRALSGKYPKHLMYKLFERKSKCYVETGENKRAEVTINEALDSINESNLSKEKIASLVNTLKEQLNEIRLKLSTSNVEYRSDLEVDDYEISSYSVPNLSYPSSNTIAGASDAISIEYNKKMGRHLVASTDVKPGDVLIIERPYASVLLPTAYNLYCSNCLRRCHTLLPCVKCTKVLFCSEKCRDNSMRSSHKVECSILDHLIQLGCNKLELLAVRTLLVASRSDKLGLLRQSIIDMEKKQDDDSCNERLKGFDDNQRYRSDNYATVHWLATNTELRTKADLFRRACFACCIIHCIDRLSNYFAVNTNAGNGDTIEEINNYEEYFENKCFAGSLLLKYLQIMPCNAHEVSEMCVIRSLKTEVNSNKCTSITNDSKEFGGALYPLLSLINHSCDPNVVRHSHQGDTVVLTAIQFIPKGGQIFDNYGYHHAVHFRHTRQKYLSAQYHFECNCKACEEDWPCYDKLPDETIIYKSLALKHQVEESSSEFRKILKLIVEGIYSNDYFNKLTKHLLLLDMAVERPWKEYSECQEAIKQTLSMFANHYVYNRPTLQV